MSEETNLFNKVVFFVDQNIRGVQIGTYGIAFTGLAIAIKSVKPFSRFKRASDIPDRFVQQRIKLKGHVERVDPNGALLMVRHSPLIRLSRSKVDCLPVKIAGVNVSGNGLSWLQTIVAGNNVTFVPVLKQKDCVHCEVTLPQTIKDVRNKTKKSLRNVNLGPALISIGFGTVTPIDKSLIESSEHLKYYRQLTMAEKTALRKQLGLWYYAKPTKEMSKRVFSKMLSLFNTKQIKGQQLKIKEKREMSTA